MILKANFKNLQVFIRNLAPSRIVGIGTAGILLNLANCIIPSVAIGLCPSDLGRTCVAYLLFLGVFDTVDKRTKKFEKLSNAHKLTYVSDILATLEMCDLYVNPTRRGVRKSYLIPRRNL